MDDQKNPYSCHTGMLVKSSAFLIACSIVASLTCLMTFTDNPDRVSPTTTLAPATFRYRLVQRLTKSYTGAKQLILGTFLLTFLAIGTWVLWTLDEQLQLALRH